MMRRQDGIIVMFTASVVMMVIQAPNPTERIVSTFMKVSPYIKAMKTSDVSDYVYRVN